MDDLGVTVFYGNIHVYKYIDMMCFHGFGVVPHRCDEKNGCLKLGVETNPEDCEGGIGFA